MSDDNDIMDSVKPVSTAGGSTSTKANQRTEMKTIYNLATAVRAADASEVTLNDLTTQISQLAADDDRFGSGLGLGAPWCYDLIMDGGDLYAVLPDATETGALLKVAVTVEGGKATALGDDAVPVARQTNYVEASLCFNGEPVMDGKVRATFKRGETSAVEHHAKMHEAVRKAVAQEPRLGGKPGAQADNSPAMNGQPYLVDVTTKDADGQHSAVVHTPEGKLVKLPFTHDADSGEVTFADGDPQETEKSTVYSRIVAEHEAAVRAGDYPGHEFHGNQYAGGESHGKENEASRKAHIASSEAHDKASHQAAADAHMKAAAAQEKAGNSEAAAMHETAAKYHAGRANRFKASEATSSATAVRAAAAPKCEHLNQDGTFKGGFDGAVEHFKSECGGGHSEESAKKIAGYIAQRVKGAEAAAAAAKVKAAGTSDGAAAGHATRKATAASELSAVAHTMSARAHARGEDADHAAAAEAHDDAARAHLEAAQAHLKIDDKDAAQYHLDAAQAHGACSTAHGSPADTDAVAAAVQRCSEAVRAGDKVTAATPVGQLFNLMAQSWPMFRKCLHELREPVSSPQEAKSASYNHAEKNLTNAKPWKLDSATAATATASTTVRASSQDVVHCREFGSPLQAPKSAPWVQDQPVKFTYMPAGTHTINAGFRDGSINLTIECDPQRDAGVCQASLDALKAEAPKLEPFGCYEHEEKQASVFAKRFLAGEDGVQLEATPSASGAAAVNGKNWRSWSPSFDTDAEYAKCKCRRCDKTVLACDCRAKNQKPSLYFPEGVRGSASNPAHITGVDFVVGTLTNKPAFRAMPPVRAKQQAPAPATVKAVGVEEAENFDPQGLTDRAEALSQAADAVPTAKAHMAARAAHDTAALVHRAANDVAAATKHEAAAEHHWTAASKLVQDQTDKAGASDNGDVMAFVKADAADGDGPDAQCPACGHGFRYGAQKETQMGAVACPKCGKTVTPEAAGSPEVVPQDPDAVDAVLACVKAADAVSPDVGTESTGKMASLPAAQTGSEPPAADARPTPEPESVEGAPHGYCPTCGKPGVSSSGVGAAAKAKCVDGHEYDAPVQPVPPKQEPATATAADDLLDFVKASNPEGINQYTKGGKSAEDHKYAAQEASFAATKGAEAKSPSATAQGAYDATRSASYATNAADSSGKADDFHHAAMAHKYAADANRNAFKMTNQPHFDRMALYHAAQTDAMDAAHEAKSAALRMKNRATDATEPARPPVIGCGDLLLSHRKGRR